jgi:hypothetical protein
LLRHHQTRAALASFAATNCDRLLEWGTAGSDAFFETGDRKLHIETPKTCY